MLKQNVRSMQRVGLVGVTGAVLLLLVALSLPQVESANARWGKWKPVKNACTRPCSAQYGTREETRKCVKCTGRSCKIVPMILCNRREPSRRNAECYIGGHCSGPGQYTGQWTSWSSREGCPQRIHSCRNKKRLMARQCVRTAKSGSTFQCPARNGIKGTRYEKCKCRGSTQQEKQQALKDSRFGNWGSWGEWKCNEECDKPSTMAFRHRDCFNYMSGYYCKADPRGRKDKDRAPCKEEGNQMRCTKKWGSWTAWTACATTCSGGTKKRKRRCEGFGAKCPGSDADYEPCPIARMCPLIDGKWGSWGRWEIQCSVTCGYGVRQRIRECNSPMSSGGGRTCEGESVDAKPCHVNVICPIHGGWTDWTDWICDRTCNGTQGFRTRFCDNPYPQFGGRWCIGKPKEYTQDCNGFPCPTPKTSIEIPPHITTAIGKQLKTTHHSLYKNESHPVKMHCPNHVINLFKKEFHDSTVQWLKNGEQFKLEPRRMAYKDDTIFIKSVAFEDTGVYLCQVEYHPNMTKVIDVFTVAVHTSSATSNTQATKTLDLPCYGGPLGMLFPLAHQTWVHNGMIYKDYGRTPPQVISMERVYQVSESMAGIWECRIMDEGTGREWTTSAFWAVVSPAPSFWKKVLTARNMGVATGMLFCAFAGLVAYWGHQKRKIDKRKQEEFESLLPHVKQGIKGQEEDADQMKDRKSNVSVLESSRSAPLSSRAQSL